MTANKINYSTDSSPITPRTSSKAALVDRVIQLYGDLLYDLCESVLWNPVTAQLTFRSIMKSIRRNTSADLSFQEYERPWVLRIATQELLKLAASHQRRLTPSEQIQLDSDQDPLSRLKLFGSYFHRLSADDQVLLLLRDKYGLPYPEISTALGRPEGTVKTQRAQAIRALENWLWDNS